MAFDQHYAIATRYLDYRLRHDPDREAIRDDCLSRLWERWHSTRDDDGIPSPIFSAQRVCRTLLANHYSKQAKRRSLHTTISPDSINKLVTSDAGPASVDIADLTRSLSSRTQFLIMRLTAGYTTEQIAKELGVHPTTILLWAKQAGRVVKAKLAS